MPEQPPNMLSNTDAWSGSINAGKLGLVLDFDGTMAELVLVPDAAEMHPDIPAPLRNLTSKLDMVAILSGRPARDIQSRVGMDDILYVGQHGIEFLYRETLTLLPQDRELALSPESLVALLKSIGDGPGIVWEVKEFSLAIHYRMAPDKEQARLTLNRAVEAVPEIQNMEILSGNMVLEIRGSDAVNKGSAIEKIAEEHNFETLIFLGDDTTDVDALKALRKLNNAEALMGIGVAVIQDGIPSTVLANADYRLDGVPEVAKFLKLLDQTTD
jgi:trehalose 6-phosphate phosphatase